MSLFPHSFISSHRRPSSPYSETQNHNNITNNPPSSFHPLFRLLDDFDNYSRSSALSENANDQTQNQNQLQTSRTDQKHNFITMKTFTPKFDVKETSEAYELYGELPGIERSNVEIEFVDAETLSVRGKVERSYSYGTPPSSASASSASSTAATTSGETDSSTTPVVAATIKDKARQPSVEDEQSAVARMTEKEKENENKTSNAVATKGDKSEIAEQEKKKKEESKDRFWVSERSVGEFARSFTFPVRVDQDGVTAGMKNGVLSIVVPKARKVESRKIVIN